MLRINLVAEDSIQVIVDSPPVNFSLQVIGFTISEPGSRLAEVATSKKTRIVLETYPDVSDSPAIELSADSIVVSGYRHLGYSAITIPRTPETNQEVLDFLVTYANRPRSG